MANFMLCVFYQRIKRRKNPCKPSKVRRQILIPEASPRGGSKSLHLSFLLALHHVVFPTSSKPWELPAASILHLQGLCYLLSLSVCHVPVMSSLPCCLSLCSATITKYSQLEGWWRDLVSLQFWSWNSKPHDAASGEVPCGVPHHTQLVGIMTECIWKREVTFWDKKTKWNWSPSEDMSLTGDLSLGLPS